MDDLNIRPVAELDVWSRSTPKNSKRNSGPEPHVEGIREPIELGNFCLVGDREYVHNTSKMAYLVEPSEDICRHPNWDLNAGYEQRVPKDHSLAEKLDNLLRWICDNVGKFRAPCDADHEKLSDLHTDFVSYRGLLATIMGSLYEEKEAWILGVTLYRGTRYLCQYETEAKRIQETSKPPWMKRACAWGYKFEQYMTSSTMGGKPTPQEPVNEKEEFCSVVRTRLGQNHSLVFGAEVDGVDESLVRRHPELRHSTRRFIELKTSREVHTARQRENLARFKMIKWWAQSYLIGIPRVICGFRDDDGFVRRIHSFDLAELVKKGRDFWDHARMISFLDAFLTFVKINVIEDNPKNVYLFSYVPAEQKVKCMMLPENHKRHSEYLILPNWYLAHMEKHLA